jgi:ribosomal protein S18 acetylase RimI-like enzyme
MTPTIRPMTTPDAEPAAALISSGGWGDRSGFFAHVARSAACRPLVAVLDGEIVGTGVGTVNGPVGWVGTIFVAPDARRRGLGRALTEAVIDRLEAAGCRTLLLVASAQGRPLYERLGFDVQTHYHTLEAPGLTSEGATGAAPPTEAAGQERRVRPFRSADLPALARLDRAATGEDREHLLRAFARPESALCLEDAAGEVHGFVVRASWGGGATIAGDPDDALLLLDARRRIAGADHRVRAGVLDENRDGLARLGERGWTEAWTAPRLIRGARLDWEPRAIWGQFNHALG